MINRKKHIPVSGVKSINDPEITDTIFHIKTTPFNSGYRHFYWHRKLHRLTHLPRNISAVQSVMSHIEYSENCFDLNRTEVQVGDSIIWMSRDAKQPFVCATVLGIFRPGRKWRLMLEPSCSDSIFQESSVVYDPDRCFIISNNRADRRLGPANVAFAKFQDEVDRIEGLLFSRIPIVVLHHFFPDRVDELVREESFLLIHEMMFKLLYEWAGMYRKEEIVVTDRENKTMDYEFVPTEMAEFFKWLKKALDSAGNNRTEIINIIAKAHSDLAWIHPFQDGNGRVIRLFLDLVAFSKGLRVDSEKLEKKKKSYHYAVRKAIYDNNPLRLKKLVSDMITSID
jgi:cell filamentation protein